VRGALRRKLVRFCLVTRELTTLAGVDYFTVFSFATFTRGGTAIGTVARIIGCVSLLFDLIVGDTAMQGGLHARLCHAFLV